MVPSCVDPSRWFSVREGPAFGPVTESSVARPSQTEISQLTKSQPRTARDTGFVNPISAGRDRAGGCQRPSGPSRLTQIPLCMGKGPSRTLLCPHARVSLSAGSREQRIKKREDDDRRRWQVCSGARAACRDAHRKGEASLHNAAKYLGSRFSSRFRRTVGVACASLAGRRTLGRCAWFWVIRRHPAAYLQRRLAPHHRAKHKGACCGRCSHGLSPGQAVPFQHKAHLPASTLGIFLDVHHLRIRP